MTWRWQIFFLWIILLIFGLAIYVQTFSFGFVFDDHRFIVLNPYIKNFDSLHTIWSHFPRTRMVGMYSFAWNYSLHQLQPMGYHIFNFMVHSVAVILVWAIAAILFRITQPKAQGTVGARDITSTYFGFFVALLFLVHPGQTQAVTYISQRFESLATVFYLSTVYFYLCARTSNILRRKIILFLMSALCAGLGILTKEVALTAPLMVVVIEWILRNPRQHKMKPMALVAIALGLVLFGLLFMRLVNAGLGIFIQTIPSESHDGDILNGGTYILTQMRVFLTFFRLLIFPIHQTLDYDYPMSIDLFHPPLTFIGMCVLAIILFLIIKLRHKYPLVAIGLAWTLITFSINLVPRQNIIFEHKLYLISFGFILAFVSTLFIFIRNPKQRMFIVLMISTILSIVSFNRNGVWRNELVLWEDIVKKSPGKWRVLANLGRMYGQTGQYEKAVEYFTKAIDKNPNDDISYQNRAIISFELGFPQKALADFNKAIEITPTYSVTYVKRGWFYKKTLQIEAAFADFNTAIRLEPYAQDAYIERGILLMELNRNDEALVDFQKALSLDPFSVQALIARGVIYSSKQQYPLALKDFTQAQKIDPTNPIAGENIKKLGTH